jgi:SAM-dependent methyltransferase
MSPDSTAADPTMDVDFQKMGIYIDGRTKNELDELLAVKSQSEVTARDLYGFSCMHYLDDEPMNEAASFFGLSRDAPVDADAPPKKILDFGAGFAGDARVMACEFPGSELTCVEVQPHIHAAAERFTALVDASARCKHQCADIFNDPVINGPFDHMFSVLVILHIPERDKLWRSLAATLKPGGTVYVEDYFAAKPLTDEDKAQLAGPVACPYLPSREEYTQTLKDAGFVDIQWETMNDTVAAVCQPTHRRVSRLQRSAAEGARRGAHEGAGPVLLHRAAAVHAGEPRGCAHQGAQGGLMAGTESATTVSRVELFFGFLCGGPVTTGASRGGRTLE